MSATVLSSFDMKVLKAGADSSKFLRLPWILNNQWHISPPALKAADPVGPTTCTLLVFCVIFRIAVTSVLISVLLLLPAILDKFILKGLKVSVILWSWKFHSMF